ncbi:pyridoxal phosphate-dependent transferase [Aspergillus heterothallicus]
MAELLNAKLEHLIEEFVANNPRSKAAFERARNALPAGNTRSVLWSEPFPLTLKGGHGAHVTSVDGRDYLDFVSDFTAGLYGHSHPAINQAVADTLGEGFSLGGVIEQEAQLGEILQSRFKSIERVRFCNSGTEANTFALATATAFTGRNKILVFDKGYHGGTISFPSPAHNPMNLPHEFVIGIFDDIEKTNPLIDDTVAAILIEPMQMAGGVRRASLEFLQFLRQRATEVSAVLIFDEVVTSRLHFHGLQGAWGVYPDMTTLGKYIGGGFSFGAFGGRADIMGLFDPFIQGSSVLHHSGTFNNNVFTMTAAVAAAKLVTEESLDGLNKLGDYLREKGNEIVRQAGLKGVVLVGYGSLVGIGFLGEQGHILREIFYFSMLKEGILIGRRGFLCLNLAHTPSETLSDYGTLAEDGIIEELGYTAVYRRVFRSLGNMCMVVALTCPLSAIMISASYQIIYGGYWGLSWGWIIPNVLMVFEVLAVAELASSMPVNGSFYWWAAALAPPQWSHAVSFITGWLNVMTMFASAASFAYAVASSFSYAIMIAAPDTTWTNAQVMALSLGVLVAWVAVMAWKLERITFVYIGMAILVLIQTLVFIIGLPVSHSAQGRPYNSAKAVFGEYANFSDWSPAVAVPHSWLCALWVNSAWMVPVYVAEETHNATREIPKSILHTWGVTAIMGTVVCLITAFCIENIEWAAADVTYVHHFLPLLELTNILHNASRGFPLFNLILDHWGQTATSAFFLFATPVGFIGGSGTLLVFASQIAAFARDGGLPWSSKVSYVHPRLNLPIYALGILATGTFLVLIIALSPEASAIIYSLAVVTCLVTYIIPISFRITAGARWVPGPWNLGRWSIPIHVMAVLTQLYFIIMECFPPEREWTATTFNYNFVLTAGGVVISVVAYLVCGKWYKGLDMEALDAWRRHHAETVE